MFTVQFPERPELFPDFGMFARGASPGTQGAGQVVLSNQGIQTATTVLTNLYLSTDQTFDSGDILVGSTTNDLPTGPTTAAVTVDVPAGQPVADYYLLARIDADLRYAEIVESDNIRAGPHFATGPELSPISITTSQSGINPGETATFDVGVAQNGVPFAQPVGLRVYASSDQVFDQNDRLIGTQTVTLNGSATQTVPFSGTLPTLPPGAYYAVAQIDPNNQVIETAEANNVFVGPTPFQTGPDFAIASVSVPPPASPGGSIDVTTTIGSLSVPFTGNVAYRLYASRDATYDASDVNLGSLTAAFTGQASVADTKTVMLPANLGPGRFYLIAWVDPNSAIAEVNEMNNRGASAAPMIVGPELGVSSVTFSPISVEVGQNLHATGAVRSTGTPFTGNVSVRIYISSDAIFDPGDDALYEGTLLILGSLHDGVRLHLPGAADQPGQRRRRGARQLPHLRGGGR